MYDEDYGSALDVHGDYMAIGSEWSDSLALNTGIVYLYKYEVSQWELIGILKPSVIQNLLHLGSSIAMGENYIVVGVPGMDSKVYVYKKPAGGWMTMTETAVLDAPELKGADQQVVLSEDENKIIVGAPGNAGKGSILLFTKGENDSWTSRTQADQIIVPPDDESVTFPANMVLNDSLLAVTEDYNNALLNNRIWLYNFNQLSGEFDLEATLTTSMPGSNLGLGMTFTTDGLFASIYAHEDQKARTRMLWYKNPDDGVWKNGVENCSINFDAPYELRGPVKVASSGNDIFVASTDQNARNIGFVIKLNSGVSGWCTAEAEVISTNTYGDITHYFGYNMAASGDHVVASYASVPEHSFYLNGVSAITKQGFDWYTQLISKDRKNHYDHRMGATVFHYEDYLFASATLDPAAGTKAGKVYIHKKQATGWQRVGTILPNRDSHTDDVFGSSFAALNDELAIGAGGFEPSGSIFIYKNVTGWQNPQLVQTVTMPDTSSFERIGSKIVMTDRWLISTFVNHSKFRKGPYASLGDQNSVIFFEKVDGEWVYHDYLDFGFTNLSIDIEGDVLVVGSTAENFNGTAIGTAFLLSFNEALSRWEIAHYLTSSDRENVSGFGYSVEIEGDHIFVGAPFKNYNGLPDVGAAYVFVKPPGGWTTASETSLILPKNKIERQWFGSSLKNSNNLLLVGAIGADSNSDLTPRNEPGELYVIQSLNYFWTKTIPLLILQGDSFRKDYYGYSADATPDYMFIGAPIEDTKGYKAGAVYITDMPPSVKLSNPICSNEAIIQLFGYPFGGVWSGPGIVDSSTGTLDPSVAGVGVHELRYTTPNCYYVGRMEIEVKAAPTVVLQTPLNVVVCEYGEPVILSSNSTSNNTYQWYYKSDEMGVFTLINNMSPSIEVLDTGQYYLETSNGFCKEKSEVIYVGIEHIQVTVPPEITICGLYENVVLQAAPVGGLWSGEEIHQSTGTVNVLRLTNGSHSYTYSYTSSKGCVHSDSTRIDKAIIPDIVLETSGDICSGAQQEIISNVKDRGNYTWEKLDEDEHFIAIKSGADISTVSVSEAGTYRLKIDKLLCSATSDPITIGLKVDSLFVPNVITPNSDYMNDEFMVIGNTEILSTEIFNRYGDKIYESSTNQPWRGNVSGGVYFWIIHYTDCGGKIRNAKGNVHVVK
ncbi:MAG TPA: gliding motility-associated C-terminal domain-containing protein [Chryseolinea sp.]|nr:gliding motility-associated C-terminal domain-containing protein [Chryseolinea sp.]